MLKLSENAARAPGRSPWARRTPPILLWLTLRSRCHWVLLGSAWARRWQMLKLLGKRGQGAGQIALSLAHAADRVVADAQVSLPLGVTGIDLGQTLGNAQALRKRGQGAGQIALGLAHAPYLCCG